MDLQKAGHFEDLKASSGDKFHLLLAGALSEWNE